MVNFFQKKIVRECLVAYHSRIPDSLDVKIRESKDGGYWVEISNLSGCMTQVDKGEELFEMVNDAVLTYFEIPQEYAPYLPVFLPPMEIREQFKIEIPAKFLNSQLILQKN